jgi:ubiquinone biosynthesis protein UbiJ
VTPATLLARAVEVASNRLVALDPDARTRLEALAGTAIGVELKGLGLALFFLPRPGGLRVRGGYSGQPDTYLRATPLALMRLGETGGMFSGEVEIEGDTDLGRRFQAVLQDLQIDWEELLSRVTGDVVAHQMGSAARGLLAWSRRAGTTLRQDTGEFLQEEAQLLPPQAQVEHFFDSVDTLRDDVERLEARVRRLADRLGGQQVG